MNIMNFRSQRQEKLESAHPNIGDFLDLPVLANEGISSGKNGTHKTPYDSRDFYGSGIMGSW